MPEESARGRFVWHDLMTPNGEGAKPFYTAVMGWGTEKGSLLVLGVPGFPSRERPERSPLV